MVIKTTQEFVIEPVPQEHRYPCCKSCIHIDPSHLDKSLLKRKHFQLIRVTFILRSMNRQKRKKCAQALFASLMRWFAEGMKERRNEGVNFGSAQF